LYRYGEVRDALDLADPELRNRFVTGDWSAAADRSAAQPRAEGEVGLYKLNPVDASRLKVAW
jgi:hypothetical protein